MTYCFSSNYFLWKSSLLMLTFILIPRGFNFSFRALRDVESPGSRPAAVSRTRMIGRASIHSPRYSTPPAGWVYVFILRRPSQAPPPGHLDVRGNGSISSFPNSIPIPASLMGRPRSVIAACQDPHPMATNSPCASSMRLGTSTRHKNGQVDIRVDNFINYSYFAIS